MGSVNKHQPGCCCGTAGPAGTVNCTWCTQLIPAMLHATDANGPLTLTWKSSGASGSGWYGCYTKTISGRVMSGGACVDGVVTTAVGYALRCPTTYEFSANRKWIMDNYWVGTPAGSFPVGSGRCQADEAQVAIDGSACPETTKNLGGSIVQDGLPQPSTCRPVNLSFTFPGTGLYPGGTVTVTE